ncbi:MAG: hypothetical protein J5849_06870 [Clostridia bacterium]|nr:hypothetical protein [Clostridia bacterium]
MKKSARSFLLLAALLLLFSACAPKEESADMDSLPPADLHKTETGVFAGGETVSIDALLLPADSPLSEKTYDVSEILADLPLTSPLDAALSGTRNPFYHFKAVYGYYPTENVREIPGSDHGTYLVYPLNTGGRLYVFFRNGIAFGAPIYAETALSHADFADVRTGDTLEKVEKIDSALGEYRKAFDRRASGMKEGELALDAAVSRQLYGYDPLTSIHLLKDGVLCIFFDAIPRPDSGYDYTVREVIRREDAVLPDFNLLFNREEIEALDPDYQAREYSVKVLERDLLP